MAATMLGLVLLVGEAGSYFVLRHLAERGDIVVRNDAWQLISTVTSRQLEGFYRERFSPRLGWVNRPNMRATHNGEPPWSTAYDAIGARHNRLFDADSEIFMAAYGDSFIHGDEVDDSETWPYYLSRRLGRYVANFGVSAYGVDQAYLRYKLDPPPGPPPKFVYLGILEDDLRRALTRWLGYMWRHYGHLNVKPRLVVADGMLREIPSPITQPILDLKVFDGAVRAARWGDTWYARQIALAPPWSYRLARAALVTIADRFELDITPLSILPSNVWASATARTLLNAILDDFVAVARSRGSTPVIAFFDFSRFRPETPAGRAVHSFIEALRMRMAGLDVPILAITENRSRRRGGNRMGGHFSPVGNEAYAEFLLAAMQEQWPPPVQPPATPP